MPVTASSMARDTTLVWGTFDLVVDSPRSAASTKALIFQRRMLRADIQTAQRKEGAGVSPAGAKGALETVIPDEEAPPGLVTGFLSRGLYTASWRQA